MKINRNLIWDYPYPTPRQQNTEAFQRWYLARVLMRGGPRDIRAVGVRTIRKHLSKLSIPPRIRAFWRWYFEAA